jgi:hypothetical protein
MSDSRPDEMTTTIERKTRAAVAGAAPCSANLLRLQNETKINFCNAWHEMQQHLGNCDGCCEYMYHGIGDLCDIGKDIIARKLAYVDTTPDWSPNAADQAQPPREPKP